MINDLARRYLDRLGAAEPVHADLSTLRELQLRHLSTVPFENLSIHIGEPIRLSHDALVDKIVSRRRGGFCYELNGAFAWLLRNLGYQVELLAARVFKGPRPGRPFEHLALQVTLDEPWLVDVGFGRFTEFPLRLNDRGEQADSGGRFRLIETDDGDLDVVCNRQPQYRLEARPRQLDDFIPTCWYLSTSPDSNFTTSLTCSRITETGRVTLAGDTLIVHTANSRTEEPLASEADVLAAYRDHFDIVLDRAPALGKFKSLIDFKVNTMWCQRFCDVHGV